MPDAPLRFPLVDLLNGGEACSLVIEPLGGRLRLSVLGEGGHLVAGYLVSAEVAALLPTAIDEARVL